MFRSISGATALAGMILFCLPPMAAMAEAPAQAGPAATSSSGLDPIFARAIDTAMRNFADAVPPSAPPVAEGVNAAATADEPGRAQRQTLAGQLIELDGTKAAADNTAQQIAPMVNMALQSEPNLRAMPAADQAKISALMSEEFQTYFIPQLLVQVTDYYADHFTMDELQSLVATFQAPTMRKYVSVRGSSEKNMEAQTTALAQQTAVRALQRYIAWKKANPG
jgi:hypothetical protein